MPSVHVHLLPDLVAVEALTGKTVVVIDCLRATTTIAHALAAGAREVIPCLEVDEALRRAAEYPAGQVLLGGERHGVRIEGFNLGNSPTEYSRDKVAGRSIVFTTTNGTRAMQRCRLAACVLTAGLVNRQAIVQALAAADDVHLVCAGTDGEIGLDDALTAGAIADELLVRNVHRHFTTNDETSLAIDAWTFAHRRGVLAALRKSLGGRNLIAEGFEADIVTASRLDMIDLAPRLDVATWSIRA